MKEADYYLKQLSAADKREEKYRASCADCEALYTGEKRFNILFSNTELLLAALVSNDPKPVIRVRYPKQQNADGVERATARAAGEAVERALVYNNDVTDFKNAFYDVTKAALLYGRGVAWLSYECEIVIRLAGQDAVGLEPKQEARDVKETVSLEPKQEVRDVQNAPENALQETIKDQRVRMESLGYKEFRCAYARKWEEVGWVARLHVMTRRDLEEKFGPEAAAGVPLGYKDGALLAGTEKNAPDCAAVWEVWDKEDKTVVFVAENHPALLSAVEDPLGLPDFFPCARPLQFVQGRGLEPAPEYRVYKKTAKEIEKICRRIDNLVGGIKAVACAPARLAKEINAMSDEEDNAVVTVDSDEIGVNKGLSDIIQEYPNAGKSAVLDVLERRKQSALSEIFEITGIADILRGQGSAEETATQSRIKGVFGSLRLKSRQRRLQQFVRDVFKLTTDIICEHFTQETLQGLTSIHLPQAAEPAAAQVLGALAADQPAQSPGTTWETVMQVLRQDKLRSYTIEVESSATVLDQDEDEKARRMELFQQTIATLQGTLPLMERVPEATELFKNLLSFTMDAYPQSRVLKESAEEFFAALEQKIKQPAPPVPTPEATLAQAEILKAQAELERVEVKKLELQLQLQKTREQLAQEGRRVEIDAARLVKDAQKDQNTLRTDAAKLAQAAQKDQAEILLKSRKDPPAY